ncbi:PAS domain S-box protein [Allocoleopsis franciscana]|uniref:histidine kinase n=1 Tax=Allocoleopsis franciscana PCC 7113 TaxID=1173027 RepID=K9W9R5_9CYAN|nr:PAS domain S-box protein [Allocoleopsis franciscana]AFZ16993.1 PAS domain S-box [Allocoleopsis franciscana PCC 7113]
MRHKANVNILLVDDQPHYLLELEAILESLGHNLVKADSGEQALRYLLNQEFALILLDVQMPEMDGLETAKRIRDTPNGHHTPVIFIADSSSAQTGESSGETQRKYARGKPSKPHPQSHPSDTEVLKAYALGAVDYLFKPLVPEILRSKVTAWISLFQETQVLRQRTAQLEAAMQQLQQESAQGKQAELALQELNQQLELRVQQRTAELQQANERLQAEVEERRQAAAALRTSEARYKAIVQNSYDIITFTDEQDNIYYQNSTRERILGYPVTESSCKRPAHEVHLDDISKVQAAMSAILAQPGMPVTVEYRMKRADGSWAWLESVATNWLSNPDIRAIVANSRDISEHKQAQEVLRQRTQRERLISASIQRIRETLDLDVILSTTVEEVRQFLQVDRVLVYRIWPDSTGSTIAESVVPGCLRILGHTFPPEVFPPEFHHWYCQGRVRAIVHPETDQVSPCLIDFLKEWGVKSKLVVPIVYQGELWGLLIAHHCSQPRQWQPLEMDLLQQLAIQLAIAIHQANLYQQLQLKLAERKEAENALRQARDQLEIRVIERTAELTRINASLQAEIRERIAAEQALRTSEERFRVALKNSPTTVFNQDIDLRYTWLYNSLFGFSFEQVVGQLDCELFGTEDGQRLTAIKRQVLTTGVGSREETSMTINGEIRHYDLTVEPLLGSNRDITGITCAAMDITEILAREQQLRAIFESSLDAIAIIDNQGTYVEVNPAACQLFNRPLAELLGQSIADLIAPDCDFKRVWRTVVVLGQGRGELRLLRPDGSVRDVEYAAKASFLPGRHLAVLRDITERKQTEEIRRALAAEQELRRVQLRFFSMVSHEFRTPLSTILGSAQLLKSYTPAWTEEKKLRNLSRIETAAKNMTQLLDDLLTINRAESGKLEFHPQPINLEKFCRSLIEDLQLNADPKHQICLTIQGSCPTASVDEKLIRSILNNLLSNALKYSPQGGEIHLVLICSKKEAIFQIKDAGIGIPLEDQSHLFELFHRGKNIANITGTGLGLSVVKQCLDLQGGEISIDSQVGVGTTVTVKIPLASARCSLTQLKMNQ